MGRLIQDYTDAINNRIKVDMKQGDLRPVFYMAHPVSEDIETGVRGPENFKPNCKKALAWLAWFMANDRTRVYIAPWLSEVQLVDDGMLVTTYDEALRDDEEVVRRVDGLILVGGKITEGMRRERVVAEGRGIQVIDCSMYILPPINHLGDILKAQLECH
jgi:hypothetical protein